MRDRDNTYRLTLDDERRTIEAMQRVGGEWARSGAPHATTDVDVLMRVGTHSFGCVLDDLRTVELAWLRAKAGEILETVYPVKVS